MHQSHILNLGNKNTTIYKKFPTTSRRLGKIIWSILGLPVRVIPLINLLLIYYVFINFYLCYFSRISKFLSHIYGFYFTLSPTVSAFYTKKLLHCVFKIEKWIRKVSSEIYLLPSVIYPYRKYVKFPNVISPPTKFRKKLDRYRCLYLDKENLTSRWKWTKLNL